MNIMPTTISRSPRKAMQSSVRPTRRYLPHLVIGINILLSWAFYHDWTHANPLYQGADFWFDNRDRELTASGALLYLTMDAAIILLWVSTKKAMRYKKALYCVALGIMGLAFAAFQLNFWLRLA